VLVIQRVKVRRRVVAQPESGGSLGRGRGGTVVRAQVGVGRTGLGRAGPSRATPGGAGVAGASRGPGTERRAGRRRLLGDTRLMRARLARHTGPSPGRVNRRGAAIRSRTRPGLYRIGQRGTGKVAIGEIGIGWAEATRRSRSGEGPARPGPSGLVAKRSLGARHTGPVSEGPVGEGPVGSRPIRQSPAESRSITPTRERPARIRPTVRPRAVSRRIAPRRSARRIRKRPARAGSTARTRTVRRHPAARRPTR
jgi:hypothetical protein